MKYKYNHKCFCYEKNKSLFVSIPSINTLEISDGKELVKDCIKYFTGTTVNEVYDLIIKYHDIEKEEFLNIVDLLISHNIIKEEFNHNKSQINLTPKDLLKHDRQIKYMESLFGNSTEKSIKFQEKIKSLNICIIGVGGVGSYLSYGLLAMGVSKITLVDHDSIELSNTSRQMLYVEADVGRSKIEVAKEKLKLVNPEAEINTHNIAIKNDAILEVCLQNNPDLVILAADTPRGLIPYIVDRVCHKKNIPFVSGAPTCDMIRVGPLIIPGKTASFSELMPPLFDNIEDIDKDIKFINNRFIGSVMDPFNAIAAKMLLAEIIKYFTNYQQCRILGKMILLSTDTWELLTTEEA
ncbi:HesA/MoeB/ThiF family protein [Fluviispira multicolorata]|uniref:THIF-type NAD/FAD binding fold domain-containing protein n=1 Tax=Fluviispira multicolorata TaxID=2654512 RepID=A0A833JBR3_9BACT|nr:ThiF family adenylyltransferase [Fluviispira multicolorata]KAB8028484.1 hypothetical protein GCL57_12225 [Fluviispira multicolorata]